MQSSAKTVPSYIAEAPAERRAALRELRALCRRVLRGFEESMSYGMPCYARNGVIEIGFASQKHYIAVYMLRRDALERARPALRGLSVGKGCIRYPSPQKIDFTVVEQMLVATRDDDGAVC